MAIKVPIVVIGAGPAANAACIVLKKANMPFLRIYKKPNKAGKICAGGLTLKSLKLLERLGIGEDNLKSMHFISSAKIVDRNVMIADIELDNDFYTVDRKELDDVMREEGYQESLGIKSVEERVTRIDYDTRIVYAGNVSFEYDYLIIGDGALGFGSRLTPVHNNSFCIQCEVPQVADESAVEVHFNMLKGGYGYVFPHKDSAIVGIGNVYDPDIAYKRELEKFCEKTSNKLTIAKGAFIPTWCPLDFKRIPKRVFIIGDSAGHVSPLEGEGIPYALCDGIAVAERIVHYKGNASAARSSYKEHCLTLDKELRQHSLLAKVFNSNSILSSAFLGLCGMHPNFLKTCMDDGMFAGEFGLLEIKKALTYHLEKESWWEHG